MHRKVKVAKSTESPIPLSYVLSHMSTHTRPCATGSFMSVHTSMCNVKAYDWIQGWAENFLLRHRDKQYVAQYHIAHYHVRK